MIKNKAAHRKMSAKEKIIIIVSIVLVVASLGALGGFYLLNSRFLMGSSFMDEGLGGEGNDASSHTDGILDSSMATPEEIKAKNLNVLVCGVDFVEGSSRGKLTDTIMLVSIDLETKQVNVLQVPRDTYVGTDYPTGKINAIYGQSENGGIKGLAKELNEMFQLSIDNYVMIDMTGFKNLINEIGGVDIVSPVEFTLEGVTIKKGAQHLNGRQAEKFVRNRKTYARGDLQRLEMQQIFLKALMDKMFSLSFTKIASIAPTLVKQIKTDMTLAQMLDYYSRVSEIGKENINFHSLEVSGFTDSYDGLSKVSVHAKPTADILNTYFRAHTRKYKWDELGIKEYVTDYPYTPLEETSSDTSASATETTQ